MGNVTQKEFVKAVRDAGGNDPHCHSVNYHHPGLFRVGERQIKIEMRRIARFLVKLSAVMTFDHYDKLTRAIYLECMKAERTACAVAEKKPKYDDLKP